jgi:hypothetical protein
MCFHLYAGTQKPLPRSQWVKDDPHVHVSDLSDSDSWTRSVFSKPEIQYIGSTTGCGCAFPTVMQDREGEWPYWLDPIIDAEAIASDQRECEELCCLLSYLDESEIELYGVWVGNEAREPLVREEIPLDDIRREYFRFKEGGFYRVKLR